MAMPGADVYAFPTPARLAAARLREYRALKFSTRKSEYIRDVARAIVGGALDVDALMTAPSADVIAILTALRGLGRWTADWFLARCCGRGDVCPAGDLAVRKAFDHHYARSRHQLWRASPLLYGLPALFYFRLAAAHVTEW